MREDGRGVPGQVWAVLLLLAALVGAAWVTANWVLTGLAVGFLFGFAMQRAGFCGSSILSLFVLEKDARPMLGATVRAVSAERTLLRRVRRDGSYASARDPRVHFGLGPARAVESLHVRWPYARAARWRDVETGHHLTLRQGPVAGGGAL